MADATGRRERNPIAALARVLDAMASMPDETIGIRDLARLVGVHPSSLQRTLEAAEDVSLVSAEGGQWELGWELFRLASLVQTKRPFRAATSTLRELSRRTGETSLLAAYDPAKHRRMFVTAALSIQSVRFVPDLYSWLPMHAGASALAILAFRPEEERRALYALGLPQLTSTTMTRPDDIERALEAVRACGVAVSRDEVNLGASAVAAPIRAGARGVTSSVAVIAPDQRFTSETESLLRREVAWAAEELSRRLGDPSPGLDALA